MRFPSGLGVQRARGRGGVILENDGEIVVPALTQPVALLGAPIESSFVTPLLTPMNTTFFQSALHSFNGVGALQQNDLNLLDAGTWQIEVLGFLNTNALAFNVVKSFEMQLVDPSANTTNLWNMVFINLAGSISFRREFEITFTRPNWFLRLLTSATVAGDTGYHSASVLFQKIL